MSAIYLYMNSCEETKYVYIDCQMNDGHTIIRETRNPDSVLELLTFQVIDPK